MMSILKKRLRIAGFIAIVLLILSIVLADVDSELPVIFNMLLACVVFYMVLYYLFKTGKVKYKPSYALLILIIAILSGVLLINGIYFNTGLADYLGPILLLLIFYTIFSWLFGQWQKIESLKNEKTKAELALLKNQIDPHFFFNTLNNLYSTIKKDPEGAQEYVLKLSELMRFTIYEGNKAQVTMEEEINYLQNFISLQKARFHKEMDIVFSQSISDSQAKTSPLLFIILVENAFKHGVEKLVDKAFVHIDLTEIKGHIHFKIENNFDPENLEEETGIGLINLRERLSLIYPDSHKLSIIRKENVYLVELEIQTT